MSESSSSGVARGPSPVLRTIALALAIPWAMLVPALGRVQVELGLILGVVLALAGIALAGPWEKRASRLLIQGCVVLLGLRMDLRAVVAAGLPGLGFAVATIAGTFALGWLLARALRVEARTSALVSTGTAICGGSAIAAVSGVIGASAAQVAVATGVVFVLNGVALVVFPAIGQWLGMSGAEFGTWAGVAIHDVSSVVGAAQAFATRTGELTAVDTATVVKLSRVIWIAPICLVAAMIVRRAAGPAGGKTPVPWFVLLFVAAAGVRSLFPEPVAQAAPTLLLIAKGGMTVALFFIGAGLSRSALRQVGWRALLLGVALWIAISVAALAAVRGGLVAG